MKYVFFFCLLGYLTNTQAQSGKLNAALRQIEESKFIMSFDSVAIAVETTARVAKKQPFTKDEQLLLQQTYDDAVVPLNNLLYSMKNDLLDPKKIKLITNDPQVYGDSYQLRLQEAYKKYQNNFLPLKANIEAKHQIDAIPLPLIIATINGAYEIFKLFKSIKNDLKKLTEQMLKEQLIEPHRLKSWSEL